MGELKAPSLSYVYDMTWAEFCIRQHAYHRIEKAEWYKVREIAYASLIGSHMNPKKLPKSKDKFIPLDFNVSNIKAEKMREILLKAAKTYKDRHNG